MIYFIDTNIFLRSLYKENTQTFLECTNFLKAVKENKVDACTGTVVLTEIVYTLRSYYRLDKEIIIKGLQSIVRLGSLKILDEYDHRLALQFFDKYSVKYIDALIASNKSIVSKKMTIVSYDRDFHKLPVLWKEPHEFNKGSC